MEKMEMAKSLSRSILTRIWLSEILYIAIVGVVWLSGFAITGSQFDDEVTEAWLTLHYLGIMWVFLLSLSTLTTFLNLNKGIRLNRSKGVLTFFGLPMLAILIPLIVIGIAAIHEFDQLIIHFWIPIFAFATIMVRDYIKF